DQRPLVAEEGVEETRLARVRAADHRQACSVTTEPAGFDCGQQLVDQGRGPSQRFAEPRRLHALLRVVEGGLYGGVGTRQVGLDGAESLAERTAQPHSGVAPGGVGGSGDEVEYG